MLSHACEMATMTTTKTHTRNDIGIHGQPDLFLYLFLSIILSFVPLDSLF